MSSRRVTVAVILLGGVLGAAAAAAFARWVLHEEDLASAWRIGAASAIGVGIGTALAGARNARRAAAGARTGQFDVSVRSTAGDPGVGPRWVAGRLDVDDDGATLVRFALGMRPLPRRPVRLTVGAVRRTDRRTPRRSGLRVVPGLEIVGLDVPGGTVEVAVAPSSADALVERLTAATVRGTHT